METINKMYYKYEDVLTSECHDLALVINSHIRCYVKIVNTSRILFSDKIRFAVDVINDKEESSEIKIFENIKEFNAFVKFQRWLNSNV